MTASRTTWFLAAAALVLLALPAAPSGACNIPVFRYALEMWPPDAYVAVVFYRGALSDGQDQAIKYLEQAAEKEDRPLNLQVLRVDLDKTEHKAALDLWKAQKTDSLPWLVVLYPPRVIQGAVWAGAPTLEAAKAIVDSPVRRTIVQRLTAGDACVWVLVESGQADKDEAAVKLLQAEPTATIENFFEPAYGPDGTEQDNTEVVGFSLVRLSRSDPAETVLLNMLLRSEEDLETDYASEPIAFPVFGRGRALFALVGPGITEENIEQTRYFLLGPCACQIKWQNPGTDLLLAAAWEWAESALLEEMELPSLPTATAPAEAPGPQATTRPAAGLAEIAEAPAPASPAALLRNTFIAIGVLAAAAIALAVVLRNRGAAKG